MRRDHEWHTFLWGDFLLLQYTAHRPVIGDAYCGPTNIFSLAKIVGRCNDENEVLRLIIMLSTYQANICVSCRVEEWVREDRESR